MLKGEVNDILDQSVEDGVKRHLVIEGDGHDYKIVYSQRKSKGDFIGIQIQ